MGRPSKWPDALVAEIRHQRFEQKRKVAWLSETYDVPIDTVRDWLFRGRRTEPTKDNASLHEMR